MFIAKATKEDFSFFIFLAEKEAQKKATQNQCDTKQEMSIHFGTPRFCHPLSKADSPSLRH